MKNPFASQEELFVEPNSFLTVFKSAQKNISHPNPPLTNNIQQFLYVCKKLKTMNLEWIELREKDYPRIKEIYDYYILNTTVTFTTGTISLSELKEAILMGHPKYKSFVIKLNGSICGYCYFSQHRKRDAYERTAEVSIYLIPGLEGKGIGTQTLEKMQKIALENGLAVLIGIISAENEQSVRLFEKCGFEKCAHYKKVGKKFNRLLDVVAYQKILDE